MDKSLFKKYIDEMKQMQKKAVLPVQSPVLVPSIEREDTAELTPNLSSDQQSQQTATDMQGQGALLVNVTSVRELYPLRNAKVTVFTGDRDNRTIFAEGVTDISGKAGPFTLSAPSIKYSETADSEVLPFAYYNLLIEADGFIDTIYLGVQIFDKVTSIQKVNLPARVQGGETNTVIINELGGRQGV